tara:strand:+ start:489 stop:683 length:195 start_codon:yes stop_codon:yes gene_type:complete
MLRPILFGELTEDNKERFFLSLLDPTNPLFPIVGKRGLDEILGDDYEYHAKTIAQIEQDIRRYA